MLIDPSPSLNLASPNARKRSFLLLIGWLAEPSKSLRDLKLILYGNSEAEPVTEACAQLTQEFFKSDTLRRLITSLQNLNLEELLTRHKSTVAEFLTKNEDWFFADYNSKLLESSNYITRRQAIKLLGDILLDWSNSAVMTKYVSSMDSLRILMNLLRESSQIIQIEAFHVFKQTRRSLQTSSTFWWQTETSF